MIKNRTSGVPVSRTLEKIENCLVRCGATGVMKEYEASRLKSLRFTIPAAGKSIAIRLPADAEAVYEVLRQQVRRPRKGTLDKLRDQAERTAWKLMQDWVEVQVSLIEMQQVTVLQVFLPHVWDGKRTFYEHLSAGGFKLLSAGKESS